jgi:hypothetical protein
MPLLNFQFPAHNLHIYELGNQGLSKKQIQVAPSSRELREVDYGAEGFAGLYHNEDLVTVSGKRLPFIVYADFNDIFALELKVLEDCFQRTPPISDFEKELGEAIIKPNYTNGRVVSLQDWKKYEDGRLELTGKQAGYFDLLISNCAQDFDLSGLSNRFNEGDTFRKLDIEDGKRKPFNKSFLANTLGAAYMIKIGKKGHYVFGRRRPTMAVEGGLWGAIGTTPVWRDYFRDENRKNEEGNIEMGYTFNEYTMQEFKEELALDHWEIKFEKGWLVDELYRGPALYTLWETPISVEEMVDRCRKQENVMAREEHDYLMFAGPLTSEFLSSFFKGLKLEKGEFILHAPSVLLPHSVEGVSLKEKLRLSESTLALMKIILDHFKL